MPRLACMLRFCLAAALAAPVWTALAQDAWPTKPVKIMVPFEAGSAADRAVRIVGEKMGESLGQQAVVENATGAGGLIGTNRVVGSAPDGYTLAALNMTILTIQPHMHPSRVKFDPFADFIPIHGFASIPTLLGVSNDTPAANVRELIALAKSKPGALNYSSGGPGSPQHLAAEMFQSMTGTKLTHVPYKGATAAAADLAAGRVQVMFIAHSLAIPFIPERRVKLIAFTGPQRGASFPELPTLDESGVKGYDYSSWVALYALKGTPAPVLERLRRATAAALAVPAVGEQLAKNGLELWKVPADALTPVMRADFARWEKVVREAGLVQN